ncbi:hemolysin-III related-domain-containing protein [Phlyctochytrium arcticum]|nr:hemolysin-III related-domain-containing protein [Phlyctochytrium arcticum]
MPLRKRTVSTSESDHPQQQASSETVVVSHGDVVETTEVEGSSRSKTLTLKFTELLPWQKDNIFILTGYRRLQQSYKGCIKSLFYVHNETGNIFSHLLGAIAFMTGFLAAYLFELEKVLTAKWSDYVVIAIFIAASILCLGLSATFHTFICHSRSVCIAWNKADYVGIIFQICGSSVPAIFYAFYCNRQLQITYLTMMTVFGFMTFAMCMSSHFSTPAYRFIRTGCFVALGCSTVIPVIHVVSIYGFQFVSQNLSFWYMISMGLQYLVGAFIYASRVPERWYPGKFDIWGQSHQLFHLLVVSAAVVHYFGVTRDFRFWHQHNPECAIPMDVLIAKFNS